MGIKGTKLDQDKLLISLIPDEAIIGMAEVLTFGAKKYTPENWKYVEDAKRRYLDALLRHLYAWKGGETLDPETGLNHLKHILTNAAFLLWFENGDTYECKCGHLGYLTPEEPTKCKICETDRVIITTNL